MNRSLGVNVDHIATLRQARGTNYPDPVTAAMLAELNGAQGITIHLREDRRHIQDIDFKLMRQMVKSKLNLEMAATYEMVDIALTTRPDMVTLVPEKRDELTTEGGLDVAGQREKLKEVVKKLQNGGILVSLFIDPEGEQVKASNQIDTDYIEIHTGKYADAPNHLEMKRELDRIITACHLGAKLGLGVNAGHGLNYHNIHPLAAIKNIEEFNIGHAIIAKAVRKYHTNKSAASVIFC